MSIPEQRVARVDYQAHWFPESYLEEILDRDAFPRTRRIDGGYLFEGLRDDRRNLSAKFFDLDAHFADMDAHGIDVTVCSPNMVGDVAGLSLGEARHTLELLNEEQSRAQRAHPDRFVGLAMLAMQDVATAIELVETAVGDLGLQGVCLLSHIDGAPIGSAETLPIFEAIERLGVPIFLHPTHRSSVYRDGQSRPIEAGMNWMYDTALAAVSLIFSGVLDRCPNLRFVHPHAGGVLPFLAGRVGAHMVRRSTVAEPLPEIELPVMQYLRERFFVDSVVQTPGALELAAATYGADRILLGTDYPWQDRGARLGFLDENVDADLRAAILERNRLPGLAVGDRTVDG